MMWALEYDPDYFSMYEEPEFADDEDTKVQRSSKQLGKFERENIRNGVKDAPLPISVFLVASVLKEKSVKLLNEAKGLDDLVKVCFVIVFLRDLDTNLTQNLFVDIK